MIEIDFNTALHLARRVIWDKGPWFVYRPAGSFYPCSYLPVPCTGDAREETGCLVGEILLLAGVPREHLDVPPMPIAHLLCELPDVRATRASEFFLDLLQVHQDGGKSWGDALGCALVDHLIMEEED